jgi:hypothetical protein
MAAPSFADDQRLSDSIRLYDNCDSRNSPVFIGCGALDHLEIIQQSLSKTEEESFMS